MTKLRVCLLVLVALATVAHADGATAQSAGSLLLDKVDVQSDADRPRACLGFNHDIDTSGSTPIEAFVRIKPAVDAGISARRNLICIDGLKHGTRYVVTLLAGLPAVGAQLQADKPVDIDVPDRAPSVSFSGGGYVLPRLGTAGLPVETVNVDKLALRIYRVNARALADRVRDGLVFHDLYAWSMKSLGNATGELVWQGEMAVANVANRTVKTAIPIAATIGRLKPGVYAAAALDARKLHEDYPAWASQWFIVSDIGLSTYLGSTGLDVTARSLAKGDPLAGVTFELIASNDAVLGKAVSDAHGHARFDAGLVRGKGGNAPRIVMARLGDDFAFLDLAGAPLDLSDRGVKGRLPPGPLDAFVYAERGIYRPGETAHVVALLRNAQSVAVGHLPLTLRVLRPDGVEVMRRTVADAGAGSHPLDIRIPANAYTGRWTVEALADPKGAAIGSTSFMVDDFVPPRIEVDLAASPQRVVAGSATPRAVVDARYLYGGAAAGIDGELTLSYAAARDPFGRKDGFQFGLAEETIDTASPTPAKFVTDKAGHAEVPVDLAGMPHTTSPVAVGLHVRLFDAGGRPVGRDATLTVLNTDVLIGIRPTFHDTVPWGADAGFQIIALDREGRQISLAGLQWNLVRESYDWRWWNDGGGWHYRGFLWDEPVAHGRIDAAGDRPVMLTRKVDWGRYRLEVYDPRSGAATSVRFHTGWSGAPVASDAPPDRVTVTLSAKRFAPGETATVFIDPPFDAKVALAVMNDGVRELRFLDVPDRGAAVKLTVPKGWAPGAYVVATAYGAPDPLVPSIPQRAVGVAWMAVERPGERLDVAIDAPDKVRPRTRLDVAVHVGGIADGDSAFVTLAAVDDGILQLTRTAAPDAAGYFLGQRRLGVGLRDLYGKLIDATGATAGDVRSGGGRMPAAGLGQALAVRSSKVVALFSGIVPVVGSIARVPLDIPDFDGRLRLMAVAWSNAGVGNAQTTVTVATPVVADLVLPRFLAPGDRSTASLAVDNRSGAAGSYRFQLAAEGPVEVEQPAAVVADLAAGARTTAGFRLHATAIGTAKLTLTMTGPDGAVSERSWKLAVRAASPLATERRIYPLSPGASQSLPAGLTAGYLDSGLAVTMTADTTPPIDIPTLLRWLYLYPYGCAEQTTSTAMPLLYVGRLNAAAKVLDVTAGELAARVDRAIRRLAAMQGSDGHFGTWSWHDRGSTWLTAYVMDFLTRARQAGHFVPETVTTRGFAALERAIAGDQVPDTGRAYALHILARSGRGDAYALAYAADRMSRKPLTDVTRALLGAAFAELGDPARARALFDGITGTAKASPYGSPLRDSAMVTALLAESGMATPTQLATALSRVDDRYAGRRWTSTQEKAWLVLAANAALRRAPVALTVDGDAIKGNGPVTTALAWPPAGGTSVVRNEGADPLYLALSWSGYPVVEAPAAADGLSVERAVYDLAGHPLDGTSIAQHERVVVVLTVRATDRLDHQAMVVDLLPAGLELENARLEGTIDASQLAWLGKLAAPDNVELRDDRYVAALDLDRHPVRLAYIARAVTPGRYVVPAPYVEDMYRPYLFARGTAGRLDVTAP